MSDFGDFVPFSPDNVNRDYVYVPERKKRRDFAKRKKHKLPPRKVRSEEPLPRIRTSLKPRKRPYRKRRISEIQRDSKYQRKLAARRGRYGRRVRKLKYSKKPASAGIVKSHDIARQRGSHYEYVHIRAHARHPRGYKKRGAAKPPKPPKPPRRASI